MQFLCPSRFRGPSWFKSDNYSIFLYDRTLIFYRGSTQTTICPKEGFGKYHLKQVLNNVRFIIISNGQTIWAILVYMTIGYIVIIIIIVRGVCTHIMSFCFCFSKDIINF